jgi:hypothetical protein
LYEGSINPIPLRASSNEKLVGTCSLRYEVDGQAKNLELKIYDGITEYHIRFNGDAKNVSVKPDCVDAT